MAPGQHNILLLLQEVYNAITLCILTPSHSTIPDRSPSVPVNIKNLIDDVQCYQTVRELRWAAGVRCPSCESQRVTSTALMTRSQPVNSMSVKTVANVLMI